jgi:succinate dehydrogenase hydrophobic anchor subunit
MWKRTVNRKQDNTPGCCTTDLWHTSWRSEAANSGYRLYHYLMTVRETVSGTLHIRSGLRRVIAREDSITCSRRGNFKILLVVGEQWDVTVSTKVHSEPGLISILIFSSHPAISLPSGLSDYPANTLCAFVVSRVTITWCISLNICCVILLSLISVNVFCSALLC